MNILLGTLFGVVCVLLIVIVLLQKGRGGGLGALFGGAGSSAFGTRTGDVFTWITIVLTALFLLLAIASTLKFRPKAGTVLAPILEPSHDPVGGRTWVRITCETRGAKIAFTTDGTDPDESTAEQRSRVAVRLGQELRVQAFLRGWKPSPIVSARYDPAGAQSRPSVTGASATQSTQTVGLQ